ncbi:hypothetical protein ACFSSA_00950 [Luteolibacter algae]|uniref:Transmembrane protein n=1 Tax=Luteolibacter algae TaxID=454151 RepID=A0ABW5D3C1_9BACT
MTPHPPALPRSPQDLKKESKLDTLSVLHYVMSGLNLLMVLFIILHGLIMITVFSSFIATSGVAEPGRSPRAVGLDELPAPQTANSGIAGEKAPELAEENETTGVTEPPSTTPAAGNGQSAEPDIPKFVLPIMYLLYFTLGLAGAALAVGNFLSGRYLKRREKRRFCTVVAAVNCLHFPLGTALGVFTLVTLTGPEMDELYAAHSKAR